MHLSLNFLTYILLSLPLILWADEKSHLQAPTEPVSGISASTPSLSSNNKKSWIANMQRTLPTKLCQDKLYFVQCFETNSQECTEFTHLLVEACLNNIALALPQELNKEQGEYWGQMIGRCSYDLYEKFMQSKKRNLPNCQASDKHNDLPKSSQTIP